MLSHTGPVFCSGMDLTTVADLPAERQPINAFPVLLQRIWEFDKPVIARVDGKARAGGIGLIAACDIALASPAADFAFTEVRLGLVPAVISVPLLPRMANRALLELCLTGETFDAAARARRSACSTRVCADSAELDARWTGTPAMLRLCEPAALAGHQGDAAPGPVRGVDGRGLRRDGRAVGRLLRQPAGRRGDRGLPRQAAAGLGAAED